MGSTVDCIIINYYVIRLLNELSLEKGKKLYLSANQFYFVSSKLILFCKVFFGQERRINNSIFFLLFTASFVYYCSTS